MGFWRNLFSGSRNENQGQNDPRVGQPGEPGEQLNDQQIVHLLNLQVVHLSEQGQYEQALEVATQACDLARQLLGDDDLYFAAALNNLAGLYREMGDKAAAEPLYGQVLEIMRKARVEDHPQYVATLNNLAEVYQERGNYVEAEPLFRQVLDIFRATIGEDHPNYVTVLNNLAELYRDRGDYKRAEPLYRRALELLRQTVGEDHPNYASILNNLAVMYQNRGDYAEAEPLFRQALEITRRTQGEDHLSFAATLNGLAAVHRDRGDYAEAESLLRRVNEILRATVGVRHPYYARSLKSLASLYQDRGDYVKAELLSRQALEIQRITVGEGHPDYARTLIDLAESPIRFNSKGGYAEAEQLLRQALEIFRTTVGERHPDYAATLIDLAGVCYSKDDYDEAESLLQQALELWRTTAGDRHPDYARALSHLASLYRDRGDYAGAESLLQQAIEILRTTVGEKDPRYTGCLNLLATTYQLNGNYAMAEPLYRQALETTRKTFGKKHPAVATSLYNLVWLCVATNREAEAMTLMKEAISIDDQNLEQIFSIGSEMQRTGYLRNLWLEFYTFLSLILQYFSQSSAAVHYGLDLVLRRKAIGIEAWQAERKAIERGDDLVRIPLVNALQHSRIADRKAVARALPGGSALVEFIRFGVVDFGAVPTRDESKLEPRPRYLVFVLLAGQPDKVRMIDVGEAEPIDKMIASFRASITGEAEQDDGRGVKPPLVEPNDIPVRSDEPDLRTAILATRHARPSSRSEEGRDSAILGSALRQALFDSLLPALGNCKRLFIAPDGDLARLPFEVLPGSDGGHLIDEYQISYLSVGRDVLRFEAESTVQPGPPLVAADPDFDLQAVRERRHSASVTLFERLDGTRQEGERIAELLGVVPLLGPGVLEKHIKGSRSPRVLHIATHGFFLPDAPPDTDKQQIGLGALGGSNDGGWARLARLENPLLRSGLALAGANTWLRGGELPEEAEDAILNAEDVTSLDLLATELVVLSACETGLGHAQVGEGVYGLRNSFVLAGAKTLVMSLWKVPDQQTLELMEDFYQRLLEGQPRADALRETQLAMKERYPDPLYWGAFICQGDPDPLTPARSGHD